jgi:2-methylisocitrate lyase-like PEP mutase family enzyme
VVQAVAPKPVNVLTPGFTVAQLAALGVRRISVGGGLAAAAWGGFLAAAKGIAQDGVFTAFTRSANGRELNGMFAEALKAKG